MSPAPRAAALVTALALTVAAGCSNEGVATHPTSTDPRATSTTTTTTTTTTSATTTSATTATTTTTIAGRAGGSAPLIGRVVVVDPGHNGANGAHPREISRTVDAGGFRKACNTTGTAEGALTESRFNWEQAGALRTALEAAGATVVMTRPDDAGWGPCIDERGLTAQRVGADLLVSVHADGSSVGHRGFHVASAGAIAGYTDTTAAPSARLAAAVRDALVAAGFEPSNYVGDAGLVVRRDLGTLNRAGVPAVLVELGNMHDPTDLARLDDPDDRERTATALTAGVVAFLTP